MREFQQKIGTLEEITLIEQFGEKCHVEECNEDSDSEYDYCMDVEKSDAITLQDSISALSMTSIPTSLITPPTTSCVNVITPPTTSCVNVHTPPTNSRVNITTPATTPPTTLCLRHYPTYYFLC
uniref:Uncharacterized protein n=1 Tax=Amphimedon queenslandica TaxID=400682 RepID=A0A1X7VAX2_AMPQE